MAIVSQKRSAAETLARSVAGTSRWLLLISGSINILLLIPSLYSMQALGRVLPTHNLNTLIYLTVGCVLAYSMLGALLWLRSLIQERLADWFERSLKPMLVRICLHRQITGVTAGQALSELQNVRQFIAGNGSTMFFDAPWSLVFAIVLWMLHPYLVIMAVFGGVFMLALTIVGEKFNRAPFKEVRDAQQAQQIWLEKIVRSLPSIRAMRLENTLMEQWHEKDEEALKTQHRMYKRTQFLSNIAQTFKLILATMQTAVSVYLIINNELNPGAIMAVSMLSGRVSAPFEQAVTGWMSVLKARDSYKRLQQITGIELPEESMALPSGDGKVSVAGAYWRPNNLTQPILKNISFEVAGGECVAILGASGAGKSSLISLLAGIEAPTSGSVRLDGAEIADQTGDFGQRIGYLPQIVEFFPGTIRENIARMALDIDDEAVVAAAQSAGVHEMILSLPQGYNTIPEGLNLSMGQRQRIGLARALYGPIELLLLDEPNAHVDASGDSALMEALKNARQAKITTFVVSHKTNILNIADKCLLLGAGEVRDFCDARTAIEKYVVGSAPSRPAAPTETHMTPQGGINLSPHDAAALRTLIAAQMAQKQQQQSPDNNTPPQNPNNPDNSSSVDKKD